MRRRKGGYTGAPQLQKVLLGIGIAVGVSLACVLAFAGVLCVAEIPQSAITPVNQAIKVVSILIGTLYALKSGMRGFKCGPLVGAAYMLLGLVVYCVFDGGLLPFPAMLGDLALGAAAGLVSGVFGEFLRGKTANVQTA